MLLSIIDGDADFKTYFTYLLLFFGVYLLVNVISAFAERTRLISTKIVLKELNNKIFQKAVQLDVSCYENPEFYDKYQRATLVLSSSYFDLICWDVAAIIGGIIAAYFVCKKTGLPFLKLLDLIGMALPIGQGIGRWGNFTNQEAFGVNTTSIFGMTSDKIVDYINSHQVEFAENGIEMNPDLPVHPTFLYESVWCLLGFVVLFIVCQKFHKFDGQLILGYGIIYGLERTVVEGLRIDSLYIGGTNLRVSQLVSLALVIVCTVITIYKFVKLNKEKKMTEVQENV